MIIKLSFLGTLVPGIITQPVGIRVIHGDNRITASDYGINSRYLQFEEMLEWLNNNIIGEEKIKRFVRKETIIFQQLRSNGNITAKIKSIVNLFRKEPCLLYLEREFERLVKGMFGDNVVIKILNKLKVKIFRLLYSNRIDHWHQSYYL